MEGPNSKTNFFQVYQSESNISGMNRWSKSTQNEDQEQQDTLFHIESDEFLVAAKALAKFHQDRADTEARAKELGLQLALQQERACELKKKVDAAKRRSAELRAEYQRSEKRLLEILTNHREIPLMRARIKELQIVLPAQEQEIKLQVEMQSEKLKQELELKEQGHRELLEQKAKQLERDLKALRQVLAQEDESRCFYNLEEQYREELEKIRTDHEQQLAHEKATVHVKCLMNIEELQKKIQILKKEIQQVEDEI